MTSRRHFMGEFIAQFNEEHGIRGLKIGDRLIDNDELRTMEPIDEYPADQFAHDNLGKSFKRPKGWTQYRVVGACDNPAHGYGPRRLVVVERFDSQRKTFPGQTTKSVTDFEGMIEVSADELPG